MPPVYHLLAGDPPAGSSRGPFLQRQRLLPTVPREPSDAPCGDVVAALCGSWPNADERGTGGVSLLQPPRGLYGVYC